MADGPVAVGFLADELRVSQPKVSRHLAYMRQGGYVSTRRDGKWIYYGINEPDEVAAREILRTVLASLCGNPPGELAQAAEIVEKVTKKIGTVRPAKRRELAPEPAFVEEAVYPSDVVEDDWSEEEYEETSHGQREAGEEMEVFLL